MRRAAIQEKHHPDQRQDAPGVLRMQLRQAHAHVCPWATEPDLVDGHAVHDVHLQTGGRRRSMAAAAAATRTVLSGKAPSTQDPGLLVWLQLRKLGA